MNILSNFNFTIDTHYFHQLCINTLIVSAFLLLFVLAERLVYYALLNISIDGLGAVISGANKRPYRRLRNRDVLTRSLASYIRALENPELRREQLEDIGSGLFIRVNGAIGARLWLLDTVVTAAPLLGLLGTILGIMDTFRALSAGGISDPAAVSRGIGDALLATAIGIGVALFGLLGHNLLHRVADHLGDQFKRMILMSERINWRVLRAEDMGKDGGKDGSEPPRQVSQLRNRMAAE